MARDTFVNPASGVSYAWPTNHSEEDEVTKQRNMSFVASTAGNQRVWTQGEEDPLVLHWSGKILTRAHYVQMWAWYTLCRTQTIYLYDFDGQAYEGMISSFAPKRERKLSYTGRDPSLPHNYWSYSFEFTVYRVLSGDLATAGVSP